MTGDTRAPTLPRWTDAMSDNCSVPKVLLSLLPVESEAWKRVCRTHDEAYYYGGSILDKIIADATALIGWARVAAAEGIDHSTVLQYYDAVRAFGGPGFKVAGVSWAFGGDRFCYGDKAVPA